MWNKIIVLCICLVCFPSYAGEGKFTFIQETEPAPFVGTLFDPTATARILADSKFIKEEYELRLGFELAKQQKSFDLELEQLQISLDTEKQKYETILAIKEQQIEDLNTLLAKKPGGAALQGYLGGFLVGAATTLLVITLVSQ